ncbi:Glycosyltransferase involved in cell wall bisynthesis [Geodermatophilus pulveris]|uniref:Glycosyltransferase involved in cell wall bisynthesis n=1 Tax=Geodermatophilus pulveris TaxID=1564159 RepID=A0A239J771_9ACTN|nr:glycosyltransferase family 4 protein [Geodermatophilus pulveris]SNT01522.1 Glycosyltransferase involved in cell wall bisynthesis [Geodermatophilus pulveris]
MERPDLAGEPRGAHGAGAPAQRPRILALLPDVAWPLDGGKRLRQSGNLRGLAAVGDVDLAVLFSTAPDDVPPVPPDVRVREWRRISPDPYRQVHAAVNLARGLPVRIGAQRWDRIRGELADWSAREYDLVWFGGMDLAHGLRGAFRARRTVVDYDDIETAAWQAYLDAGAGDRLERLQRRIELPLWGRIQTQVAAATDAVVVCSHLDVDRLGAGHVAVIPNTYPEPAARPRRDRSAAETGPRVVVVANWETDANADSARFAATDVLPALRRLLPGVRLRLVGRNADRLADLGGLPGVDLVGPVDDVGEELAGADVALVPTRYGGGTRLKAIEAFAYEVPVVSTALGCEGLGVRDDVQVLVRDEPEAIAEAVRRVVEDEPLRTRLVAAGTEHYRRHYRPQAAVEAVTAVVDHVLVAGGRGDRAAR